MNRSTRTLGITIAASLGLHGVLALAAAGLMTVLPEREKKRPASLLVSHSDLWHYRKGTSAPQSGWQTVPDAALDGTWLTGPGWIGYGEGQGSKAAGTELSDMRGGYRTVYLRRTFTVTDSTPVTHEAVLDIDADDGFIAWIDGVPVARDGPGDETPNEPAWNAAPAVLPRECSFGNDFENRQPVQSFVLGPAGKALPQGTHVLSVLLINESIDSDDAVARVNLYTRKPAPEATEDDKELDPADDPPDDVSITFLPSRGLPEPKTATPSPATPENPTAASPDKQKFVRADGGQRDLTPLNEQTPFISSQNMRASSTAAPTPGADPNRISQEGMDIPVFSLNTRDFSPGGETPAPPPSPATPPQPPEPETPASLEPVKTETTPQSQPPPASQDRPPEPENAVKTEDPLSPAPADKMKEKLADQPPMRDRPPETLPLAKAPTVKPPAAVIRKARLLDPVAPATRPSSSSKPSLSSVKTKSLGSIALRAGEASEDARDTPEGRYRSIIHERVGMLWNAKLGGVRGVAGAGVVEVEYDIDAKGGVSGVKLVDPGKANPVLEDVCLTSIIKVKLPPPPEEIQRELRDPLSGGKLRCKFTFYRL